MTREEAIKVLERAEDYVGIHYINGVEDPYINPYLQKAIDFVVSALSEQEERRWIPVTERLPEEGDYALCVLKGFNYGGKIQVCKFVPADKFKDKPYFEHFRNGFPSVTHWMPLPQPPKGE